MRDLLVIHVADTPNGRPDTAEDIHRWHQNDNGWHGIGYHYVVLVDGDVQRGRPEYWDGAHAPGYNHRSIAICLIGRDKFSDEQWDTLEWMVRDILNRYPGMEVVGHNDLDPSRTCPNFNAKKWFKQVSSSWED